MLEKGVLNDLIEDLEIHKNKLKLKKKYGESLESGKSDLVI